MRDANNERKQGGSNTSLDKFLEFLFGMLYSIGAIFTKLVYYLRRFCFTNYSIIDLGFTLLYTLEQAWLIRFTYISSGDSKVFSAGVAYFALVVIFTFAIHKIFMQSRMKHLELELTDYRFKNESNTRKLEDSLQRQIVANDKLKEVIMNSQTLNSSKISKMPRGVKHDR